MFATRYIIEFYFYWFLYFKYFLIFDLCLGCCSKGKVGFDCMLGHDTDMMTVEYSKDFSDRLATW